MVSSTGSAEDESVRAQLERSNRALRMLLDVNQALIRATDEQALLGTICRVVVEVGGYRMAWVGLAEGAPSWTVRPRAVAGFEEGYLAEGPISWGDAASESPVSAALRTGKPTIVPEIPRDPGFGRRAAALERGYLSAIVLPLFEGARPLGILKIYAARLSPFDPDEVAILTELAGDIAFGMATLRARRERDQVIQALGDTERQLRTLIDSIPDFISRFDTEGRFRYLSPSVLRATGAPSEAILGRTPLEVRVSSDMEENLRIQESISRAIATGEAERLEVSFATPRGSAAFEVRHLPERDESGRVVGVLGIARDLEPRRAAERQAFLLNYAIDNVVEGVFLMEGDSPAFTYVNQSAADSLGYTREQLTGGMTVIDIDPAWTRERWEAFLPTIRAVRRLTIETTHRTRDSRMIPVEITGNVFEHGGREYNMAISRDISERKAAETALRASEAAYRTLVENTPDLIVRWNRSLERVLVNRGFTEAVERAAESLVFGAGHPVRAAGALEQVESGVLRVFETAAAEMIELPFHGTGAPLVVQLRLIPERDESGNVTTVLGMGRDISALKQTEREVRTLTEHAPDAVIRFDRECRYLYANPAIERFTGAAPSAHIRKPIGSVTARGLDQLGELLGATIAAVFGEGAAREIEVRIAISGGNRDLNVRFIPEPSEDGVVATALAVVRDVTVQRELEEQLRHSQKMEAVGQLAGGIAHDFNNMLAVIHMQCALLLEQAHAPPEIREGLSEILTAAERASNLTRQLLMFSRRQASQPIDLEIRETAATIIRLLRRVLGEDVTLETRFAPSLPLVHADPGMMEQVLMNLAINARDAMPAGGTLTIALDPVEIDASRAAVHPGRPAGSYVRLAVADTGTGIPQEALPRIFEPFFTTKEVGKGTGLGLATVFAIVEQHHGWIEVQSAAGAGTTFEVYLPALRGGAAAPALEPRRVAVGGSEVVLVVEDEPALRAAARGVLELQGYRVLEAESGEQALERWRAEGANIQLVVTDLVMPGVSGRQLAERLLAERPDLPVLYITGYSPDVTRKALKLEEPCALLQKPFEAKQLAAAVRRALDRSGGKPSPPEGEHS